MLFIKVLAVVLIIFAIILFAYVLYIALFELALITVRPFLKNIWAWCFKRNIPFPNLWEGPTGVVAPFLVAFILELSICATAAIKIYTLFPH